jgi:hypothetical protein
LTKTKEKQQQEEEEEEEEEQNLATYRERVVICYGYN